MNRENIIVKTKLNVPQPAGSVVERKYVSQKLRELVRYKAILINAPAGSGKTTTLASVLAASGLPYAWLSIDEGDNDPVRFWRYVIAALAKVYQEPKEHFSDLSVNRELILSHILTGLLIDKLCSIPGHVILVLDDFHLIYNEVLQNSLAYFVKNMPSHVSIVILSRKELDNEVAGLFVRGQVLKITGIDLAFNPNEAMEFFRLRNLTLTREEASAIVAQTEGWAAGLVVACLAMEEGACTGEAIGRFSGRNRHVDSFINQEVFVQWPDEIKTFLIYTSILDRFCAPLCRAVTGLANSDEVLQQLRTYNSFVISLDQENEWFRYHHLFAEFLQTRLQKESSAVIQSLYRQAADWYKNNGFAQEAIDAFLKAGDFAQAGPMIEEQFSIMTYNGEISTLHTWLSLVPESYYANDIMYCISYAWILAKENQFDAAQEWTNRAVLSFNSIKSRLEDKAERDSLAVLLAFAQAERAMGKLNPDDTVKYYAEACQYELPQPIMLVEENPSHPAMLKTVFGFYGRLNYIDKVHIPFIRHMPRLVGTASAYSNLLIIESLYERNQTQECYDTLVQNLGSILDWAAPGAVVPAFITLAKLRRAGGDNEGAFNAVSEGKNQLQEKNKSYWLYILDLFRARLHMDRQEIKKAGKCIGINRLGIYDRLSSAGEFEYMIFARYLYLTGQGEDAIILLNRLQSLAEKENRLMSRIEILCLSALAYHRGRDKTKAMQALDKALSLGREHGYARTFIDEMQPMAELLAKYLRWKSRNGRDELYDYAKDLFKLTTKSTAGSFSLNRSARAVTLTPIEYRIMQLLGTERTNEEIARELCISVNTVKFHNRNIYGKLEAKNRLEAINRAREAGILL